MQRSISALSRRSLLGGVSAVGGGLLLRSAGVKAQAAPIVTVDTKTIDVNGKAAKVFSVTGTNGRMGVLAYEGDRFKGALLNNSPEPLQMHWHGQVNTPASQDRARPDGGGILVGEWDNHDFELTPGTHWMHAHTLSEQQLLAAPMVTLEKGADTEQNVIVMLHDFSFRTPQEILAGLGGSANHGAAGRHAPTPPRSPAAGHQMGGHTMGPGMMMGSGMMGMTHANDVTYDAYLANDRTLDDPDVVKVEAGGKVRLRIINGGTATAFFVSTPGLSSQCVAVDGTACQPLSEPSYPLAQGQRIDLIVHIPKAGGAFPLIAQVEASRSMTGLILATPNAPIRKQTSLADKDAGFVDLGFESRLRAQLPLASRRPDQMQIMMLGEEVGYRWTINGRVHGEHSPMNLRRGERVEMTFMNPTSMMHPMHLHGHHFQVVGIGRQRFSGALRDTVIVPAHMPVTVAFDATHLGAWFLHCHHLYHMATGMMTEVRIS